MSTGVVRTGGGSMVPSMRFFTTGMGPQAGALPPRRPLGLRGLTFVSESPAPADTAAPAPDVTYIPAGENPADNNWVVDVWGRAPMDLGPGFPWELVLILGGVLLLVSLEKKRK